jgi:hypothetical protein
LFNDDGEKVDGRAGPRSENVVLQKSAWGGTAVLFVFITDHHPPAAIDHIEDLLADRSELLSRLNTARNSLARGHPLLTSGSRDPLWEREWTGGEGAADDDDEDDDDE